MAEGVDYSFQVPSAAGLAAAGKRFAGRYVGPGSGKFVTPAERDALFAHGIDIFLLAEGNADSAAGGYAVGVQHANIALAHSLSLGAPASTAIYFAVDYDVAKGGWDAPREYLRGACDVLGVARVGVYGEHDVMVWAQRDRVATWFFQTYAWSSGQWFAGNHVEQYRNGVALAGGIVDLCRSRVGDFGQWRADGSNPGQVFPPDESGEIEMPPVKLLRVAQTGMILLTNGTTWYHLPTQELVDAARVIWGLPRPSDIGEQHLAACGTQVPFPVAAAGDGGPAVLVPHVHESGRTGPAQPE